MYCALGCAFITEDGSGVAVWRPPQYWQGLGMWRFVRAGFLWTPFNIGWELAPRRLKMLQNAEHRHRAEINEPHWFLELIGVDPERQRTGSGAALIRHIHEMADRDRLPSYVITHEAKNVVYYERHGFKHIKSESVLPDAPPTCSLLRPPSEAGS
jgi:GNAT superfamily N-acetyltransferase